MVIKRHRGNLINRKYQPRAVITREQIKKKQQSNRKNQGENE